MINSYIPKLDKLCIYIYKTNYRVCNHATTYNVEEF